MNPQLLPATARDDVPAWQQTAVAFLAEKERRSGSRRTVDGYARFERLEYELTPDSIDLGLDAALPPIFGLASQIGEFARGERTGARGNDLICGDRPGVALRGGARSLQGVD